MCASTGGAIRLSIVRCFAAVIFAVLVAAVPAQARPGDFDRSFAGDGRAAFLRDSGGYVAGLTLLDGRRPLLSLDTAPGGTPAPRLLTLTAGGHLAGRTALPGALRAPSFADGYALTRIAEVPTRYSLGPIGEPATATLTLPGVDTPPDYRSQVVSFGIDGSGRALLTVVSWTGRRFRNFATRLLPDGTPDPNYRVELARLSGPALVRPDGRLYVISWGFRTGMRVQAFAADGRRLPGFRSEALRAGRFRKLDEPAVIAAGPRGSLLVAGGNVYRTGWVTRLRADGRVDRRFGARGLRLLRRFTPHALARDRHGRIVLAGLRQDRRYGQAGVTRLSASGNLDRRFGIVAKRLGALRGVRMVASEARYVAIDARGRIVIAGETYDDDYLDRDDTGRSYPAVARLHG